MAESGSTPSGRDGPAPIGRDGLVPDGGGGIQDGPFRFINPAFARIFGYRPEEIRDRLGPLDLTADEDREKVRSAIRRRLEEGESTVRYEVTGCRKDGGTVRLEVHGTMIELGHERAITGILIDITERRALEEQLRHAQRAEGLGELTGAIGHDFNNYLTAIIAPIEMALQDLGQEDPARKAARLAVARASRRFHPDGSGRPVRGPV